MRLYAYTIEAAIPAAIYFVKVDDRLDAMNKIAEMHFDKSKPIKCTAPNEGLHGYVTGTSSFSRMRMCITVAEAPQ